MQHLHTPLAKDVFNETERKSLWPNRLVCSTRPSTSRRGEIVLDVENVSFADVAMKDMTLETQIPQHCEVVDVQNMDNRIDYLL